MNLESDVMYTHADVTSARRDARIAAGLVAIALVLSLFFNGVYLQYLAFAQWALLLALAWLVVRSYRRGFRLARSPLPVAITLFWLWLAVSMAWSVAWYLSFINFWWVGSVILVCWLGLVIPDPDRWWRWVFGLTLSVIACLIGYAFIQFFLWKQPAHATFLDRNSFAALVNLVALPLAAALVTPSSRTVPPEKATATSHALRWLRPLGWGVLFCAMLTVALTKSRGAILSLAIGLVILVVVTKRSYGWRRAAVLMGVFAVALVAANWQWHDVVLHRLVGLHHPLSAGATRFVIWERAWELLKQHPFSGIGLGTFWLAYPPFRAPGDTSAGFYVHNDYLQLWIEVGLPGLLLWLGIIVAASHQFLRMLRFPLSTPAQRTAAGGVFAGLTAVAFHSLFTFNLYLLPIDIVAGVLLARLQQLAVLSGATNTWELVPARRMTGRGYRTVVILVAAIPLLSMAALAESVRLMSVAHADMRRGDLVAANAALSRAEVLTPGLDTAWYTHAEMLARSMQLLVGKARAKDRQTLFDLALKKLARAQALDPLRPQVYKVRGDLFARYPHLAGAHALERAQAQYRLAISHDPRDLRARAALAALLEKTGHVKQAANVLVQGLDYWQPYTATNAHYVERTMQALGVAHDTSSRAEVAQRFASWLRADGYDANTPAYEKQRMPTTRQDGEK